LVSPEKGLSREHLAKKELYLSKMSCLQIPRRGTLKAPIDSAGEKEKVNGTEGKNDRLFVNMEF